MRAEYMRTNHGITKTYPIDITLAILRKNNRYFISLYHDLIAQTSA